MARQKGGKDREIDVALVEGMFSTVTNVDFDPQNLARVVRKCVAMRAKAQQLFEQAAGGPYSGGIPMGARPWTAPGSIEELVAEGRRHPVKDPTMDPDIQAVQHTLL